MSEEAPAKQEESGAPAWVMTFADLMSLLMCFFVLLLSFSEMDLNKYKQVAGSMKNAFGVQREIKTMAMPKGTSVIAQEFSPGRPSPTPLNVIRQNSIDDTKQTLEFTDVTTKREDGEDDTSGLDGEGSLEAPIQRPTDAEQLVQLEKLDIDEELLENYSQALDTDPETVEDAQRLLLALEEEVRKGLIEIVSEGKKILVRIREKGSFPSGSASFRVDFLPAIVKLREELKVVDGKVRIAGHTDNVPINTARFRSNWELSASRSVTVAHELLKNTELDHKRFVVEGHGDASPIAPNDTADNRALNRRVELTIVQGKDEEEAPRPLLAPEAQAAADTDDNKAEEAEKIAQSPAIDNNFVDNSSDPFAEIARSVSGKDKVSKSTVDEQKALEERIRKFSEKTRKIKREAKK